MAAAGTGKVDLTEAEVTALLAQVQIAAEPAAFVRPDGSLDVPGLMAEWQSFWRKDGHLAAGGFSYQEAGPHLMQKFQSTVNTY